MRIAAEAHRLGSKIFDTQKLGASDGAGQRRGGGRFFGVRDSQSDDCHGLSQEYSGGVWSLSGAGVHLLPINPPYGCLTAVSVCAGRSTKNTESATIALAVIMRIACSRIPPLCASMQLWARLGWRHSNWERVNDRASPADGGRVVGHASWAAAAGGPLAALKSPRKRPSEPLTNPLAFRRHPAPR